MKKVFLLSVSILVFGLFPSCGGGKAADAGPIGPNQMTMTSTVNGEVKITLSGKGEAVIDWGDGSPRDTVALKSMSNKCTHTFDNETERTIRVAGETITSLSLEKVNMSTLDVSQNPLLKVLNCGKNDLTTIDLSANTELTDLYCGANQLTALDLSKNTALKMLSCGQIKNLKTVDLSANTALESISFQWGNLQSLDLSANTALKVLMCDENDFSTDALNALLKSLHGDAIEGKKIHIAKNPGTNDCDPSIATDKGWIVNK